MKAFRPTLNLHALWPRSASDKYFKSSTRKGRKKMKAVNLWVHKSFKLFIKRFFLLPSSYTQNSVRQEIMNDHFAFGKQALSPSPWVQSSCFKFLVRWRQYTGEHIATMHVTHFINCWYWYSPRGGATDCAYNIHVLWKIGTEFCFCIVISIRLCIIKWGWMELGSTYMRDFIFL